MIGVSNRLTYICSYQDMAHRERAWNAFGSDPEWLTGRAKSEENGPLVARVTATLMRATPYSPMGGTAGS